MVIFESLVVDDGNKEVSEQYRSLTQEGTTKV